MDSVILYSQPTCPQCKMVHMLLDKKGIEYEERQDINEMHELGINHTPTLVVNGVMLVAQQIRDYVNSGTLPISDSCSSCEVK